MELKISHGAFVSARRNLVDTGLLTYAPQGGSRPPIYTIVRPVAGRAKDRSADPASASMAKQPPALMEAMEAMPRVTGAYALVDDWESALMDALGDCLDIDDCSDGRRTVYSHQYGQRDVYVVDDDGCGGVSVK